MIGCALSVALAAGFTALALGLYRLGDAHGWTGEGPGMLVVMLAIPLAGLIALATWAAVAAQWRLRREGLNATLPLALLALGLAGSVHAAREQVRHARPSHDAPVSALGFRADGTLLVSLDEAGTLKVWDVAARRLRSERREPALAGAHELLVTPDGVAAVALGPRGASVLRLDAPAPAAATLPGVEHAALLPGGRLAWAAGEELRSGPLAAPDPGSRGLSLGAPIRALAADREGMLAVALADGRLLALAPDGEARRPLGALDPPATRLAFSPGGAWLAAVDGAGRAWIADLRRGELRPLEPWMGLHHAAFVADDVLVYTAADADPAALSLALGETPTSGSWLNHGQVVTALAGAPGAPLAAVALGPELLLARAPQRAGDYVSDAERLVDPR